MEDSTESKAGCRAKGLPLCETESSIEDEDVPAPYVAIEPPKPAEIMQCTCIPGADESDDIAKIEEEVDDEEPSYKEPATADDQLMLEDIQVELSKQKSRVEQINKMLSLNVNECPVVDPCLNMQLELNRDNVHPEIVKLQRNNFKLRQQLQAMQLSCTAADQNLKYLRKGFCRDLEAAMKMQRSIDQLDSFKRTMQREHLLCLQRFRHLQREKYDGDEWQLQVIKFIEVAERDKDKFVSRLDYKKPKHEAIQRLNEAKLKAKQLHDFLCKCIMKNMTRMGSTVGISLRLGSDITNFLHHNEQLFGKNSH